MKLLYWIFALLITTSGHADEPLYLYQNELGVPVYSDRPPEKTENYLKKSQSQVETVEWRATPKLPTLSPVKYRRSKTRGKTKSDDKNAREDGYPACNQLDRRIGKLEKELKRGQPPARFDSVKQELADLRWKRRSRC